jgi:hypothetical protein
LCLPSAETLLYLVFKLQFCESSIKVPFQPVACQYPNFNSRSKTLFCKAYRFSGNGFSQQRASSSYGTRVRAEKFNTPDLTPPYSQKMTDS